MRTLLYIKEKGIKRTIEVIYQYKLQIILCRLCNSLLKKKHLQDIIVIESHNDFDCNGGAFYNYLINNGYNKKYKIIWLLKNQIPDNLPSNVIALSLYKPSIKKAYYNCIAKYLLADCNITEKMREDQISVYLSHGAISLKNVRGKISIPDTVDYILSPSENYDKIKANQLSLHYPCDKLIHIGYPCHDLLFQPSDKELNKITTSSYKKTIMWMPTFRKGGGYNRNDSSVDLPFGIPLIDSEKTLNRLNELLVSNNALLIIKLHPMQDLASVRIREKSNIKILTGNSIKKLDIDNYKLLKDVDALISDYSSIAYDYLFLNRPLAYVLSDLNEYKLGLAVSNPDEYIVGNKIYTVEDLINFISDVIDGKDYFEEQRRQLMHYIYKYQEGNSCSRLATFLGLTI